MLTDPVISPTARPADIELTENKTILRCVGVFPADGQRRLFPDFAG